MCDWLSGGRRLGTHKKLACVSSSPPSQLTKNPSLSPPIPCTHTHHFLLISLPPIPASSHCTLRPRGYSEDPSVFAAMAMSLSLQGIQPSQVHATTSASTGTERPHGTQVRRQPMKTRAGSVHGAVDVGRCSQRARGQPAWVRIRRFASSRMTHPLPVPCHGVLPLTIFCADPEV